MSTGYTLGGENDLGSSFNDETIRALVNKIEMYKSDYQLNLIYGTDNTLEDQVEARYKLYNQLKPVNGYAAFINIGGGSASIGIESSLEPGINDKIESTDCLVLRFSLDNVSIANINDIERLVSMYQLTYGDLIIPSEIVDDELMIYNNRYDLLILFASLLACLGILIYAGRRSYSQIKNNAMKEDNLEAFL